MKRLILGLSTTALLTGLGNTADAASILAQESFETDGQGSRYTSTPEFTEGSNDRWLRTLPSGVNNISGAYTGQDGSYLWAAEDTDDTGPHSGNGNLEQIVTLNTINLAGLTEDIHVSGLFGTGNLTGVFGNNNLNIIDYIDVYVSLDSNAFQLALSFRSTVLAGSGGLLAQDTDLNGLGDGTNLNPALAFFSSGNLGDASSTIDVEVRVRVPDNSKEVAFDNIIVSSGLVPEPQSAAILALGAMMIMRRRRH